ncbi:MAG: DNA cytosine methyltransferase [Motiliproteus sp.]
MISGIDLFCGAGGLTCGLQRAGINIYAGYDIDPECRAPYEINNQSSFIEKSIADLSTQELSSYYQKNDIRLLAGCAPCQPFSKYTQGRPRDDRWGLLYHFGRLAAELAPELITMENVPDLVRHDVYSDFINILDSKNYYIYSKVIYCPDYGVPQNRSRLVLLASKLGPISMIKKSHTKNNYQTVRNSIEHLPKLDAGSVNPADSLHKSAGLTPINLKRIRASTPGGSWKQWPDELRLNCHKKESGKGYPSVYGRMDWDDVSPTITTQSYNLGSGRFGHPAQDRAISLREAACIQSFPDNYAFAHQEDSVRLNVIGRMIGNAVPVALAEAIGSSLISHVKQF